MDFRALFLLALFCGCSMVSQGPLSRSEPAALSAEEGYWQDMEDPRYLLGLEGSQLIVSYDGKVREIYGILGKQGLETTRICYSGREAKAVLRQEGDELIFDDPLRNQAHRLRKVKRPPSGLSLKSSPLPAPSALAEEKVREVLRELWERSRRDQASLGDQRRQVPARDGLPWLDISSVAPGPLDSLAELQFADVAMKNSEYLRALLMEVGWIDVQRFGYDASNSAFLLVQHSWDVPMMMAALPYLKKDVDRGLMGPDTFALLYDRLQLALGLRQRYGSQVATTPQGETVVLPVEGDPSEIDRLRRQLGLIPLADYVRVFGAPAVRFSTDCQP